MCITAQSLRCCVMNHIIASLLFVLPLRHPERYGLSGVIASHLGEDTVGIKKFMVHLGNSLGETSREVFCRSVRNTNLGSPVRLFDVMWTFCDSVLVIQSPCYLSVSIGSVSSSLQIRSCNALGQYPRTPVAKDEYMGKYWRGERFSYSLLNVSLS